MYETRISKCNEPVDETDSNFVEAPVNNGVVQLVTKPSSYKKKIEYYGGLEHQLGFKDRVSQIKN